MRIYSETPEDSAVMIGRNWFNHEHGRSSLASFLRAMRRNGRRAYARLVLAQYHASRGVMPLEPF